MERSPGTNATFSASASSTAPSHRVSGIRTQMNSPPAGVVQLTPGGRADIADSMASRRALYAGRRIRTCASRKPERATSYATR